MSTRATYQINDKTFYIHHDGYPEGGAAYLWRGFNTDARVYGFPKAFAMANERAEVTEGHDAHGDTEYQYTVTVMPHMIHLVVYARDMEHYPVGGWKLHFDGAMVDFIAKHQDSPLFQSISVVGATKSEVPA